MQTSKYLLAAGVLAAVVLPLQVRGGPDTEEQAKMRDALRRALEQPTAPESQPAAKPAAAPQPAVVTPPPQPEPTPAPVAAVAPPPVAAATATVVVATPESFEAVPPPDDQASIARARELMRQKLQELQSAPAPTAAPVAPAPVAAVAPPPSAPKPAPVAAATPAASIATSNFKPIDGPASPFSASKQAKLSDLLARYRADSITAQEYHAQRAAIIAEP